MNLMHFIVGGIRTQKKMPQPAKAGEEAESRPSLNEVLDQLVKREPVHLNPSAAEMIRQDRDSR